MKTLITVFTTLLTLPIPTHAIAGNFVIQGSDGTETKVFDDGLGGYHIQSDTGRTARAFPDHFGGYYIQGSEGGEARIFRDPVMNGFDKPVECECVEEN